MPFHEVLDREAIHKWVPTATVDELKAQGWNGEFEALVHPNNSGYMSWNTSPYVVRSFEAEGVRRASTPVQISVNSPMRCDPAALARLKAQIKRFKYVAIQVVLMGYSDQYDLHQEARGPNLLNPAKASCHRNMHEANGKVRPAPWIRDLATRYMREMSGVGNQPYLAVHIRPYPDQCLDRWRWGKYEPDKLAQHCVPQHRHFHMRVGPCTVRARKDANLGKVFVMAHPGLRTATSTMLALSGIGNVMYLEPTLLQDLLNCTDTTTTFYAMVEEEIAVQASYFLGTSISSATHTIAYERLGMRRFRNNYFENMKC